MWELSDIDRDGMLDRDEFSVVRNWFSSKGNKVINLERDYRWVL